MQALEREQGKDDFPKVVLTGGVETPVVQVSIYSKGVLIGTLDVLGRFNFILGNKYFFVKCLEFSDFFFGEPDFVAFFEPCVFSDGKESLKTKVDDGILKITRTFLAVSFAPKANVFLVAGDAFDSKGIVAVNINSPLVGLGFVEFRRELKLVCKGGLVVASTKRDFSFHRIFAVSDGKGLGENAQKDCFLGAVLSCDGCDLGTEFTVNVLESMEFLNVEFLNHYVVLEEIYWRKFLNSIAISTSSRSRTPRWIP